MSDELAEPTPEELESWQGSLEHELYMLRDGRSLTEAMRVRRFLRTVKALRKRMEGA